MAALHPRRWSAAGCSLLVCVVTLGLAGEFRPPTQAAEPAAKAEVPDLQPRDWDSLQKEIATHQGKVVVVDFWSTSCEPCMREFPGLIALKQQHGDELVCIAFALDYIGSKTKRPEYYKPRIEEFLSSQPGADGVVQRYSTVAADELFAQIDLDSIPAVFVYNQQGKLAQRFDNRSVLKGHEGPSYKEQIAPFVAKLLEAK